MDDTIDYLWDRSAYPGPSLDDVYPRPSVAFAAKNAKKINKGTDYSEYYAPFAAGTLTISSMVAPPPPPSTRSITSRHGSRFGTCR